MIIQNEKLENNIAVDSCGIWAMDDQKASRLSERVARENKLDISQHLSKGMKPNMVKEADVILCMTPSHKRDLINFFPTSESKIFTFKEYLQEIKPSKESIDDPIGMSLNFYRRVYKDLAGEINRVFPLIKILAFEKSAFK
jgi:protein-tyrosine-phosphatase